MLRNLPRVAPLLVLASLTAFAQLPNVYPIFDQDAVHEIKITFPNEDWYDVLVDNYDGVRAENPYFPAALEWGPYKFDNIGVRFKGNSTFTSSAATGKRPFRIKLNEFVKGQKIDGIGSFSLSNAWNDPSFVREKLYYEMAARMGIKAPRSNFAALYINGEYWGLYVFGEVINSDFLKNYFGKGEDTGNLYKGNIGATFAYLGENAISYKTAWEKQTNEEADDWTDLIALCKLIDTTPIEELKDKLEPLMDVDSVLAALALDNATVNLDSYIGMAQNFNIYRRPSDKRWVWIPWDPSLAFGAFSGQAGGSPLQLALEYIQAGRTGGPEGTVGRPLATKLWQVPEYKERYRQIYRQLMDKVYFDDHLIDRANQLRDMIRPYVEDDARKLVTQEQFDNAMTAAVSSAPTTGPGGPGVPPGGPGMPPGGPGMPPGGPGAGPVGGNSSAPGLTPFLQGRAAWIREALAEEAPSTMALTADQSSIELQQTAGGTAPVATVTLGLDGTSTPANYSVFATTESGGAWLTVTAAGGGVPGSFKVTVGSKLATGVYNGEIRIHSPGAVNSPLIVPVSLTVN
jgi:spore coat protein CotH